MRTPGRALSMRLAAARCLLILAFALTAGHPATGASIADEIFDPSIGVRIYRGLTSRGMPVTVLTNLDDEGNRLPSTGRDAEAGGETPLRGAEVPARPVPGPADAEKALGAPSAPPSGSVRVVVNQGEVASQVDARDVEVVSDGSAGTTVIININPPAPPPRETVEVPVVYPFVVSGLPGPFRYPEHQYFLGYGPNTSSPSMFSGLGLNSGNRFGLKTGVPCDTGYDCMFGPPSGRP